MKDSYGMVPLHHCVRTSGRILYRAKQLIVMTENYLQHAPGGGIPGALGLGQAIASNIVNALMISSYVTPIPAAVIADNMLGRYNMVVLSAM